MKFPAQTKILIFGQIKNLPLNPWISQTGRIERDLALKPALKNS
jgi:hypothetical protein